MSSFHGPNHSSPLEVSVAHERDRLCREVLVANTLIVATLRWRMTGNDEAAPSENPPPEDLPESLRAEAEMFDRLLRRLAETGDEE